MTMGIHENLLLFPLLLRLMSNSIMIINAQNHFGQPPWSSIAPATTTASLPPATAPAAAPSITPLPPPPTPVLPDDEVDALNNIAFYLEMKQQQSYYRYSCQTSNSYDGITCNCSYNAKTICHVTKFFFESQEFTGVISSDFEKLSYLELLDLSGNKLHGSIPSSLWNLRYLSSLDLSENQLSGSIPDSMTKLQLLRRISLYKNFLSGSIPRTLGSLKSLRRLSISSNLLSGSIPEELGKLSRLETMYLYDNQLSGPLPSGLGMLKNLQVMQLSANNIEKELPPSFAKLVNLEIFIVSGSSLSGQVPDFVANWSALRYLNIMGTNFEGPLPSGIFDLPRLEELYVSDLNISEDSSFPPISKLKTLSSLILRNCSITDEIPGYVGKMSLFDLDLSFNNLHGEIPDGLQKLDFLCLSRNNFSGPLPEWGIQNSSNFMDFSYNNFSISSSAIKFLGQQSYLYLNTYNCCTTGMLPQKSYTGFLHTPTLQTIKDEHCSDENSQYSSLYINCGGEATTVNEISYEEDNSTYSFGISRSRKWAFSSSGDFITSSAGPQNYTWNKTCEASVPDASLYSTARISPLSLDYYGLCFRNGKYNVTLHFAEIVYADENDYSSQGIRLFDIYIQGKRVKKDFNIKAEASPKAKLTINSTENVTDNLLHIHLIWTGKGSIYAEPRLYGPLISGISIASAHKAGKRLSPVKIASITVSSLGFLLVLLVIIWKKGLLGHKELPQYEREGEELEKLELTYQQIVNATQNFNRLFKIGEGSSGTVYKAVVQDKGTFAVKRLPKSSMRGLHEFTNEVRKIELLKNENLVQLFGYYAGDEQYLLIYEYMEENSLHYALLEKKRELLWSDRYRICLQIAKGLVYLHEKAKIIHRDIKAENILLDKTLNAKISDFGLARLQNEEHNYLFTKVFGTLGYVAPEYALRGFLSEKTDVYGYGVLLLEIVSGKSNVNAKSTPETKDLLDQVFVMKRTGDLLGLVDKTLIYLEDYSEEQAETILELAILCTDQSPSCRPPMSDVFSVLEGKKTTTEISGANKSIMKSCIDHCRACGNPFQYDKVAGTSEDVISEI